MRENNSDAPNQTYAESHFGVCSLGSQEDLLDREPSYS